MCGRQDVRSGQMALLVVWSTYCVWSSPQIHQALVESEGYPRPTAYFHESTAFRRDASPLLDELGAVVDHVKAHVEGGGIEEDNLATACARCNMRKSAQNKDTFTARSPNR